MRRITIVVSFVVASLSAWVAPAVANHSPCDPSGPVCTRIDCPNPSQGNGWFWIDHHGFPHVDFTDCAST